MVTCNQQKVKGFMTIAEKVEQCLALEGVNYQLVRHPKSYSSRETAQAAHVREDHIAKAVILKDEHGFVMAVIPASSWLRLHALEHELNRKLEFATEKEIDALFADCQPGAIPPLGPAYGLETVLDEELTSLGDVYLEAGDHEHLVQVNGMSFRTLLSGSRHGHISHTD